jgi:uncharacterized protein YodC (DUF2158 family)
MWPDVLEALREHGINVEVGKEIVVEERFKVGDVVSLRSENWGMTVRDAIGDDGVRCQWMSAAGELQTEIFPSAMLKFQDVDSEEVDEEEDDDGEED